MELKGKAVAIASILILIVGIAFAVQFTGGFSKLDGKNPLKSTNGDLSQLKRDATFDFLLPNIVTDGTFGELKSAETIAGTLVQIDMEHAIFWAAPFVSENADPSGDYATYKIDNKYITPDKTFFVRYRTDEVSTTLLFIKWDAVAYSLKMDSYCSESELLPQFGIDISGFVPYEPGDLDNTTVDTNDTNSFNNVVGTDILFATYKNDSLGIEFMVPITGGDVQMGESLDEGNRSLTMMIDGEAIIQFKELKEGEKIENELATKLEGNWVLINLGQIIETNDNQKQVLNNIDTIASTFRLSEG